MFYILFGVLILITIAGLIYIYFHTKRFLFVQKIAGNKRWKLRLTALTPILASMVFFLFDAVAAIIIICHLIIFWVLSDIIFWLIRKLSGRKWRYYWQGLLAFVLTVVYLSVGWFYAHHVYETNYLIETTKDIGTDDFRIVFFADSHIGTTFDGDGFAEYMADIEKTSPDAVIVVGDYVDDSSNKADLAKACEALGSIRTTCGVYYVFGNHDKGYFNHRDFTEDELRQELTNNNIKILEDETVELNDSIYLIGRQDRSAADRKTAPALTQGLDKSKYIIMADHQPNDFDSEKESDADLVLSGHTHGGQMFPIGITGVLFGANDYTYGRKTIENTDFLVTSGISDWAVPFKTATISEYVVVDITQ